MKERIKVLVIEDVKASREALVTLLEQLHCQVESATNGYEALEKIAKQVYDLIITDIDLGQMEGITLVETLRDRLTQNIPIIGLSSYGDVELREQALLNGMDDFFDKPLSFQAAKALLEKWGVREPLEMIEC